MINDTLWGFGDLLPFFSLRWNAGVNNYMVYLTGDVPVGAYNPSRLSNVGIASAAFSPACLASDRRSGSSFL
jgi:hypothetical protein